MTDDTTKTPAASAAFDTALGGQTLSAKDALMLFKTDDPDFNADIVKYAESSGEKRAKQDEIIAAVHKAIEEGTLTVIAGIDKEPADKLTDSAKQIIEEVEKSTSFLSSFGKFAEQIKKFDFDGLGDMAKKISEGAKRKIELMKLSPIARFFKKLFLTLTGLGGKESTLEDLRTKGKQNLLRFGEAIADLEDANAQIPAIDQSLDKQENARLQYYSDYGLYLGAVLEAYRQWKEEKIPAMKAKATETRSPMDLRALRAAERGVLVLNSKATSMDTLHKKSLIDLEVIDTLRDALTNTQMNIINHLTASQAQWYASVAKQQATAAISKMVETVAEADRLNDEIFKDDQKLSQLTTAMALASFEHGSLNPELVVGFMKEKAVDVLKQAEFAVAQSKRLEARRAALAAAKDELLNAKLKAMSLDDAKAAEQEIKLLEYKPQETVDVALAPQKQPEPVVK